MNTDRTTPPPSPPPKPPKSPPPRKTRRPPSPKTWMLAGSGLLVLLAVAVFWGLPLLVASKDQEAAQTPDPAQAAAPSRPQEAARSDVERQKAKRQAESALERALALQARLIEARVESWAAVAFEEALDTLAEGDSLFQGESYAEAHAAYERARDAFQALLESRPQRLSEALARGRQALEANDVEAAISAYEIATAIAPDNRDAAQGLARAQKREQVLAHMAQGRDARRTGELSAARDAFKDAADLDPAYEPASAALREVEAAIADRRFAEAMSAVFAEIDAGRFEAAERALSVARSIKPQDEAIARAARQLEMAREQAALAGLREQAAEQVASESWAEAVETFRAALEVDANASFAVQGLPRAYRRAEIDRAFQRYLEDPTRLYTTRELEQARQLFEETGRLEDPGPKLTRQRQELARLIELAGTPVRVTIASDGQTEVTLFKMGALGRFQEKELMLTPGDYVAVGTRKGYRDVRREFSIRPGEAPERIVVVCRETV